jgi:formylglycine-generating enzyme required for sulfatase activity
MSARMDQRAQAAPAEMQKPAGTSREPAALTAPPVAKPKAGPPFREGAGPLMVKLPGGDFLMGSPENVADFNERPQHRVTLKSFSISVHEITAAEFARFRAPDSLRARAEAGHDRSRHPVTFVSWEDARDYTQWLSRQTGKRYRLPTEAEWEYAARSGSAEAYWWGRTLGKGRAHCLTCGNALDPRHPTTVGRFKANHFGLHDTAGNVAEWVQDCYVDHYKDAPLDGKAVELPDCTRRVVRGGAFSSGPHALTSTGRDVLGSATANDSVGFRVVRED